MKFQRLFSILLCVCLAIACCTSAFAESPNFDSSAPSEYLTDIVDNSRISPRGSNPPSSSKIWDWGNGTYNADFSMQRRVFTSYMFTGYSSYTISASLECANKTNKSISIYVYKQDGSSVTSCRYTDRMEASLNVSVNSGDKIYVAVAHDYDGDTATGRVSVRHG